MRSRRALPVLALLAAGCGRSRRPEPVNLTISAAASLQNAMEELSRSYEQAHGDIKISLNFGASGMLAQQIEQGAPADVFLSAAAQPMDRLAAKGLILPDTRRDLLRNDLVLIVPKGSATPGSFARLADSAVKLVALGDPGSVPAGDYGRQVLRALGLWEKLQPKLVLAKDVRQVLTYVETGNADAGIVYATDARESPKVRVAEVAPENSHAPVVCPIAVIKDSRHVEAARAFAAFLDGPQARRVFTRYGFTAVSP
jgi:molybdate transport system substrate-binding protein